MPCIVFDTMSLDNVRKWLLDHPRIMSVLVTTLAVSVQVVTTTDVGSGGDLGP